MTIKQRGNHPAVNIVRYAPAVALVWREPSLSTVIYHIAFQVVAERIRRSTPITVSEVRRVVVLDCFHALCLLDQHLLAAGAVRSEPIQRRSDRFRNANPTRLYCRRVAGIHTVAPKKAPNSSRHSPKNTTG